MRKFTLIFSMIIAIGISNYAQQILVNIDSGLVAYYPFNGNTLDSTGNKHHSTSNGVSFTADRFEQDGQAAYFNGQPNTLFFKNYRMASPNSTITFWVKPDAGTDTVFFNIFPKSIKIVIRVVDNRYRLEISMRGNKFILENSSVIKDPASPEYDFIAILFDTNTIRFYVNSSYTDYIIPEIMTVGRYFPRPIINTPEYYFKGKIDEARIFSRSLNSQEVLFLFNEKIKKTPESRIDSVYFIGHDYAKIKTTPNYNDEDDFIDFGICWSNMQNPDTSDFTSRIYTNDYTFFISDLIPGTTYYVRAFAENSVGIGYSNEVSFTTTFLDFDTIADIDGNLYKTVKIGNQIWMAQNLRTTRYANGDPILHGHDSIPYVRGKYYFKYDGLYYTWMAATNSDSLYNTYPNGIQGACPNGWHIPNRNDFNVLIDYLGGADSAGFKIRLPIGSAGNENWLFDDGNTNESGFSVKGVGYKYNPEGQNYNFDGYLEKTFFWTSESRAPIPSSQGLNGWIYSSYSLVIGFGSPSLVSPESFSGFSVRCIKDTSTLPSEENKKSAPRDSIAYNVYPNPASEVLYLTNTPEKVTVTIYDTQSRVRLKTNVTDGKVNIAFLPKGVYFIHISDGVTTQKKKFVK